MTDTPTADSQTTDDRPGEDDDAPVGSGLRRTRKVLWIAVAVAVPLFLLVVILANGEPAATRNVKSPLVGKPAPGIEGRCSASQARRSAWSRSGIASRCSVSRASGPRMTTTSSPSWRATSSTTRSFAVAVVPSTGTSAPSDGRRRPIRR